MLLLIDNYDSFTYNLFQYLSELGADVEVVRNDKATIEELSSLNPDRVVISPGPSTPDNAGISVEVIKHFAGKVPVLGVCLGHQAITVAYGGSVIHSSEIVHGKTSKIQHNGSALFDGINGSFTATRYHSLVAERETLPTELKITAELENGLIMGIEHKSQPVIGVQFHPESIATENGMQIIHNFLKIKP